MLQFALALVLCQGPAPIERDAYGVPAVSASTWEDAFYYAGYAVAEDRLWQLESSRRLARGKLAEVFGPDYAGSDREILKTGYTDQELQKQFDGLAERSKSSILAYAKGVSAYMADAKKSGKLPEGYAKAGFSPEPWSPLDSVAITIRLWHLFGRGGAGELRNLAAYTYLLTQPCKDKVLDVLDDFAWQNDPRSITTVKDEDDPLKDTHPKFPNPSRDATAKQLAALPKLNMLELLPGIRLAERTDSTRVAQSVGAPFKTGSYAVVVGKNRSATGTPLLLSAPQMGFRSPSIVHEMSISGPGVSVSGMDVPGIPGVLIGYTPKLAWAITSGVADTEDVFFFKTDGADGYVFDGQKKKLERVTRTLKIKGQADEKVVQTRTIWGPVVLATKAGGGAVFARRATYRMNEMKAYDVVLGLYQAQTSREILDAVGPAAMTFNLLFATVGGEIGYQYIGAVPIRPEGVDPRFPLAATPENDWLGVIPPAKMPHVVDPAGGLLFNWNNKPVSWWPNLDTPVWGQMNRAESLAEALIAPKLGTVDLEMAAWRIARTGFTWKHFAPDIEEALRLAPLDALEADAAAYLIAYDGREMAGSPGAAIYDVFMDALAAEVLQPSTGNFFSPDSFRVIAQPSVVLSALRGKTAFDYLKGRKASDVVVSAFKKAVAAQKEARGADPALWGYIPGTIGVPGEPSIPYSDRGTYIQIIELRPTPRGRNVLPPGVAESGPHSKDQAPLSRAWTYKPMRIRPSGVVK